MAGYVNAMNEYYSKRSIWWSFKDSKVKTVLGLLVDILSFFYHFLDFTMVATALAKLLQCDLKAC